MFCSPLTKFQFTFYNPLYRTLEFEQAQEIFIFSEKPTPTPVPTQPCAELVMEHLFQEVKGPKCESDHSTHSGSEEE